MTTALYLLRCKQANLAIDELEQVTMGMVMDMLTEQMNDEAEYPLKPTQQDFDSF